MLDVLAVGSDTLLLKRLLCHAATYCDRSVLHSQSHHLTALVTKERGGSGAPFIEGGYCKVIVCFNIGSKYTLT